MQNFTFPTYGFIEMVRNVWSDKQTNNAENRKKTDEMMRMNGFKSNSRSINGHSRSLYSPKDI